MGAHGVQGAVSAGGIIFAYLGLTPIISVASEVKRPQFTIPLHSSYLSFWQRLFM